MAALAWLVLTQLAAASSEDETSAEVKSPTGTNVSLTIFESDLPPLPACFSDPPSHSFWVDETAMRTLLAKTSALPGGPWRRARRSAAPRCSGLTSAKLCILYPPVP